MRPLFKMIFVLASIFASTFLIVNLTGLITIDKIESWLTLAKQINPYLIGFIVILILFADLFIAVPTLTVMILAGYFLGFPLGALFAIIGVTLAGIVGYGLSFYFGDKLLNLIIKNENEQKEAINQFKRFGFVMILLSRALPILPEVSACMAGITKMQPIKFLTSWFLSCIPYALIATYAGSISTLDNPKPAIITAIVLTALFWSAWYIIKKRSLSVKPLNL